VSSISELHSSYDYGVGDVHLDLSNLTLAGRHHTDVRLGRGDVTVTVPSNVAVFVRGRSGVGSVTINGHKVSGFGAEQSELVGTTTPTDIDRLSLDIVVGVGTVKVRTA
jgi:predicted membrane protein